MKSLYDPVDLTPEQVCNSIHLLMLESRRKIIQFESAQSNISAERNMELCKSMTYKNEYKLMV